MGRGNKMKISVLHLDLQKIQKEGKKWRKEKLSRGNKRTLFRTRILRLEGQQVYTVL